MIRVLFSAAIFLATATAFATETKSFEAKDLKTVVVKNGAGNVTVTAAGDSTATVVTEKKKFDESCEIKMDKSGSTLTLKVESKKSGWFNTNSCEVNFDIQVPQAVALDVRTGAGNINVIGTKGPVEFAVGSGQVKIDAAVAKLDGRTGSGSITATQLTGDTMVRTGSGDVTLTYATAVDKGDLDIKTGSGDATLYFPKEMKVLTDAKTGSGKVVNELGDSEESKFKISVRTGSGDLKIKKL